MIIDCGKRRLKSYRYGWMIQIRHKNKKSGEISYVEDRPAYPSSLADALEEVLERELKDGGDITLDELPKALKRACHAVHEYMAQARKAA